MNIVIALLIVWTCTCSNGLSCPPDALSERQHQLDLLPLHAGHLAVR
jgi:hypothetical protein